MKQVEERERKARHNTTQWVCNRCPENLNQLRSRSIVVDHLQNVYAK